MTHVDKSICGICNAVMPTAILEEHIRRELAYPAWECALCGESFFLRGAADAHFEGRESAHAGRKPWILDNIRADVEAKVSQLLSSESPEAKSEPEIHADAIFDDSAVSFSDTIVDAAPDESLTSLKLEPSDDSGAELGDSPDDDNPPPSKRLRCASPVGPRPIFDFLEALKVKLEKRLTEGWAVGPSEGQSLLLYKLIFDDDTATVPFSLVIYGDGEFRLKVHGQYLSRDHELMQEERSATFAPIIGLISEIEAHVICNGNREPDLRKIYEDGRTDLRARCGVRESPSVFRALGCLRLFRQPRLGRPRKLCGPCHRLSANASRWAREEEVIGDGKYTKATRGILICTLRKKDEATVKAREALAKATKELAERQKLETSPLVSRIEALLNEFQEKPGKHARALHPVALELIKTQFRDITEKGRRFDRSVLSLCVSMEKASGKAYTELRKVLILPSLRTLSAYRTVDPAELPTIRGRPEETE